MHWPNASLVTGIAAVLSIWIWWWLTPPRHPRNIPAMPFWVLLLPFFRPVDQEALYETYLAEPIRKHGAVKVFFAAQWNILVGRPEMLVRVLRDVPEDTFRKSGNQEKIPWSVIAGFLGDNVISASGERWRKYRHVVKGGMEAGWDMEVLRREAATLRDLLARLGRDDVGKAGVSLPTLLQRYTIACTGDLLLHMKFKPMEGDQSYIGDLQINVRRRIFHPLFLALPVLDYFPWTGRREDRALVEHFAETLQAALCQAPGYDPSEQPSVGQAILAARDSGLFTQKQFRDNLNVVFTASQENPQMALGSLLYVLAKFPGVQARLHEELCENEISDKRRVGLDKLVWLNSTILECLRLYPPLSQLVNRKCKAGATVLAPATATAEAVVIQGPIYVGYLGIAANRDQGVWGPDATEFKPERWGETMSIVVETRKRAGSRGGFITFHGGRRACLGEKYAMDVLRETAACVVRSLRVKLVPREVYSMTPAGPLGPRNLKLIFEPRE